ncbi:Mitochondrial fission 1 protein [Halotydeus destructor]|nr:Mitochondrial fission 1 protein [Halotydeus destructor]
MGTLLDHDKVPAEELKNFRQAYYEELRLNQAVRAGARTRFEYAWCLVRNETRVDIKRGNMLPEDLFATGDEESRWDYLLYLAVAYTKLGDYKRAQDGCHELLAVEPNHSQAQELLQQVQHRMTKEGLKGRYLAALP